MKCREGDRIVSSFGFFWTFEILKAANRGAARPSKHEIYQCSDP
jgi:hypothetical protein